MSIYSSHGKSTSRGGSRSSGRGDGGRAALRGRSFSRPSFNNNRRGGGNRGGGPKGDRIDINRFINKAVEPVHAEIFVPKHQFSDFALDTRIKQNVARKGYVTPTPIQDHSIPVVLTGADIVGIANTGTGKTAAFLLPLIDKVIKDKSLRVLIMVPTRELAVQIEDEYWGFADSLRIGAVTCVGGAPIGRQVATLRRNPNFVIGTPGRLKDLMERRELDISTFSTVVLDEADRMLDMGFIHDMRFILAKMVVPRHTLFFSATLSREIEMLIGTFLNNPVRVSVKTGDTSKNVHQDIVRVEGGKNKLDILYDLLTQDEFQKVLVFGRTKHGVEKLSKALAQRGFKAESIHGNKNQNKRQKALDMFKTNRIQVLVATDVAARGIDVDDVSHVINYDLPTTYEDYVHRIGRTGRAGKQGKALTFID